MRNAALTLTVQNLGATPGKVTLEPLLTSARFHDFVDVSLGTVAVDLEGERSGT